MTDDGKRVEATEMVKVKTKPISGKWKTAALIPQPKTIGEVLLKLPRCDDWQAVTLEPAPPSRRRRKARDD